MLYGPFFSFAGKGESVTDRTPCVLSLIPDKYVRLTVGLPAKAVPRTDGSTNDTNRYRLALFQLSQKGVDSFIAACAKQDAKTSSQ